MDNADGMDRVLTIAIRETIRDEWDAMASADVSGIAETRAFRRMRSVTLSAPKRSALSRKAAPSATVWPSTPRITSPGRIPAALAGHTLPEAVWTSAKPVTTTPRQSSSIPTVCPTGTSRSPVRAAAAGDAGPVRASARSSPAMIFVFFMLFTSRMDLRAITVWQSARGVIPKKMSCVSIVRSFSHGTVH